jgi:hypothetical protein
MLDDSEHYITHDPEPFLNAEAYLPHGDRQGIAKVIGRNRNADGNLIGRKRQNPILDSRIFIIEFPDGEQKDITDNLLAEHLYCQVDVRESNIVCSKKS